MKKFESHWEDAENHRRVAYSVGVRRGQHGVALTGVVPTQVTFLCRQTKQPLRSISVRTDRGRQLLAHQLRTSGHLAELQEKIETGLAV